MSLLTELKRRNVFKVGAAYVVVGWVIIEVASTIAPQLSLPEWTPRLVTFLILLGFPVALLLAWIFDMTPEGLQVTEGKTGSRRFYGIVATIAAAAIGWFFYSGSPDDEPAPAMDAPVASAPAVETRPSIAVLAFEDLSQEGDQAYFARGISEELLNILAGVGGLKVASRTSAFSFAGTNTPLPEIARQLDVAHVLEGSVRKQGTRVRITAQLIDAATDAHLWSQTYDRELTDIFAVQEEIAQAITAALQVVLGTQQVNVEAPTDNLEAYQLFLRGRTRFHQRAELDAATEDLRAAVALDPEFAEAWTYLGAVTYVLRPGNYGTNQDLELVDAIFRDAIDRAVALDPNIPLALALQAQKFLNAPGAENFATGMSLLERAANRVTEDSTPRMWLGMQYLQMGYIDRALAEMQRAIDQDPLVPINNGYYGMALYISGREAEGLLHAGRAAELSDGVLYYWLAMLAGDLVARGEFEQARTLLLAATESRSDDDISGIADVRELVIPAIGDVAAQRAAAEQLMARGWASPGFRMIRVALAQEDELVAASPVSDTGFSLELALAAWLPSMNIRERPEYYAVMEHWGIAAYWAANGYPRGCRLVESPAGNHLSCSARR